MWIVARSRASETRSRPAMSTTPVKADEVVRVWTAADATKSPRANTGGILRAFLQPGVVQSWYREPLTEMLLGNLRLLGGPMEYPWGQLSDGTFQVASCRLPDHADIEVEPSPLALVCLQRTDRPDRRVLIDGCHRAVCLYQRLQAGHRVPEAAELYTGVLGPGLRVPGGGGVSVVAVRGSRRALLRHEMRKSTLKCCGVRGSRWAGRKGSTNNARLHWIAIRSSRRSMNLLFSVTYRQATISTTGTGSPTTSETALQSS